MRYPIGMSGSKGYEKMIRKLWGKYLLWRQRAMQLQFSSLLSWFTYCWWVGSFTMAIFVGIFWIYSLISITIIDPEPIDFSKLIRGLQLILMMGSIGYVVRRFQHYLESRDEKKHAPK